MSWAAAAPNFVIGIREGLEAGLVVSILLAAVRRTGDEDATASTAPVWLGVLGAVAVAGSFAAVLTYSTSVLSSRGQDATGGLLGVLAVSLVTMMVFWMRRTAAGLSARLKGDVAEAVTMGAGALALTAFLSVGREGLETTLFLWTAVRASGQTASPLVGAGLGLAAAVALCWLLYRRALRLDLGAFFNRTALVLLVVAAGVLSYALGELQDAGWLSGQQWTAFDLSAHLDPSSWWVSIVSGITDLSPRMSVLQVVAWVAYLVVVITSFVRAGRTRPEPAPAAVAAPAPSRVAARGPAATLATGDWWRRPAGRRLWATSAVLVAVPVAAAGLAIVALPSADAADSTAVTVTATSCAPEWTAAHTGPQRFSVTDESTRAGEINLVTASGGIAAEIETLGPSTTATMTATLGPGSYTIRCLLAGQPATSSNPVQVSGPADAPTVAVAPVTLGELTGPNDRYQAYAAGVLDALAADVVPLRRALQDGDLDAARADWLTAQLEWERVGASYDSFGAFGVAVDGLPDGLPGGVHDPDFTGLHRLEYGLWHGQRPASLVPVAVRLAADIATIQRNLRTDAIAGDPTNLPIRAHEIMEDALRDHLSGIDDQGAGAAYAESAADVEVDRVVIGELAPLLRTRSPGLVPEIDRQLAALASSLAAAHAAGQWRAPAAVPLATRQPVDAAIGALLETLSSVPDLLEVPPHHDPDHAPSHVPHRHPRPAGAGAGPALAPLAGPDHDRGPPVALSRRSFLRGAAAGAAGTALTGGVLIGGARADAADAAAPVAARYPFHGAHQAGILTPGPAAKQAAAGYAAFDLVATSRPDLTALLRTLTARARDLTAGGPAQLGVGQPPADSDVLGPGVPADGLTVSVSVGASLFDDRFGLAADRPRHLTSMPAFPDDSPDPAWLHGDVLIQLCANHPDAVHHAIRDITKHTRGAMQLRWKLEGYDSPPRPSGSSRNLLGFKDGTANPVGGTASSLVWVDDPREPAWAQGGSYQVVRIIRMLVEFWDRVSINEQETMFGRRRDSGAPLDGTVETDQPDYAADPDGHVIPLDAHIRLANPRTPGTADQRIVRRSYNYDLGIDLNGNLQAGHIFTAYQQDVKRQFETIQARLVGEPLIDYVQPFGGGYFFVLPGVADAADFYGRRLVA